MNSDTIKQQVQLRIVLVSVVLLCGKFFAFFLTNSVGILTDAMESIVNVIAGFISLYSLHFASKPKDKEHPFGHGKAEFISASLEGLMVSTAGLLIMYEGTMRIFKPSEIEKLDVGIIVIAVAGAINYLLGWYSRWIGKKHNSMALIAGGKHLQSDTYSTIGLIVGLILLYITGVVWIDSALALVFGGIILYTGIGILRKTIAGLVDKADEKVLEQLLNVVVKNRKPDWVDIHNMKTIKHGSNLYINCDITIPRYYNIEQGHEICDKLKQLFTDEMEGRALVSVHSDPCKEKHCIHCAVNPCTNRKQQFTAPTDLTVLELTETEAEKDERAAS